MPTHDSLTEKRQAFGTDASEDRFPNLIFQNISFNICVSVNKNTERYPRLKSQDILEIVTRTFPVVAFAEAIQGLTTNNSFLSERITG